MHGSSANHILQRAQQRNTTANSLQETQEWVGAAAIMHTGSLVSQEELARHQGRSNAAYFAGELQRRDSAMQRAMSTAAGLTNISNLTAELAIFPYLFPTGKGYFDGNITLNEYLKMRSMQLFSKFTLVQEYLLVMIHIYMVHQILGQVNESALADALRRVREQHPKLSDKEVFRRVVRKLAPPAITGTPNYYRQNLHELLVYALAKAMPHLFVTLTADELSELKWECVRDLEASLEPCLLPGMTWQDVPTECARLFHDRMMHLLHEHILRPDGSGMFGRVQGYMLRYESQTRASLHRHMLNWLHPDDIERVCNEISASLPCCYEKVTMADGSVVHEPVRPANMDDGSIVSQLIKIVERKQMHRCDNAEHGCVQDNGECREGYPYVANRCGTAYDDRRGANGAQGCTHSPLPPYVATVVEWWMQCPTCHQ
eukprot:GHUV01004456.1.p1 GENE.GHUV01004456.1~~GHUV01004456.1.p1  ORF type:complete len:430 (+),score=72.93 GHUV01004456.1:559-1848(+)